MDLPLDVARAGVRAVLEGRASGAAYFVLELPLAECQAQASAAADGEAGVALDGGAALQGLVAAQLMITKEWSDWCVGLANWWWRARRILVYRVA